LRGLLLIAGSNSIFRVPWVFFSARSFILKAGVTPCQCGTDYWLYVMVLQLKPQTTIYIENNMRLIENSARRKYNVTWGNATRQPESRSDEL
jgi:hypothetical protein